MISSTINDLVLDLKPRHREIIAGRFGLGSGQRETLSSLGEKYDITRERVRQIEAEALRRIKDENKKDRLEDALRDISKHLQGFGGLRRDDLLLGELKEKLEDKELHHWHLRFLSDIFDEPRFYGEADDLHPFWYVDENTVKKLKKFVNFLEKLIAKRKSDLVNNQKFDFYLKQAAKNHELPDSVGLNYLLVSRRFHINPFGDFGLSHWEEINPKTMGSKAYLVIRKQAKPMHFRDVAEAINKVRFDNRVALPQTVHNELIKDQRFVLVGRGIYGLREHGFVPGTAREVIAHVLKKNGPISSREIISEVLKQRFLEKNTIILNLQNKKYFKRLPDGRYAILR